MWPFRRRPSSTTYTVATRPHPSRLLRSHSRRKSTPDSTNSLPKMVILVRTDLNMSVGKIATQAAHAAVSLFQMACGRPNACSRWLSTGQRKYVLRVESEAEMDAISERAKGHKLAVVAVRSALEARNSPGGGRSAGGLDNGVFISKETPPKTAVAILGPADLLRSFTGHLQRF
eukprot:GFKZ01002202.1.p1 GENE.GFKZ01002202.1~~GFKZ01002202.1.p1  ORF type:complete len:174 (+),score=19.25 GFKZ01002202.1:298-819(+)